MLRADEIDLARMQLREHLIEITMTLKKSGHLLATGEGLGLHVDLPPIPDELAEICRRADADFESYENMFATKMHYALFTAAKKIDETLLGQCPVSSLTPLVPLHCFSEDLYKAIRHATLSAPIPCAPNLSPSEENPDDREWRKKMDHLRLETAKKLKRTKPVIN